MKEFLISLSIWLIPIIVSGILIYGMIKKIPCYETFVDGAREGLFVAMKILPYLIAIIVCVSMFRASGAIDFLKEILKVPLEYLKIPADSLPLMITRSLSGSATLGVFSDIVNQDGIDSYCTKLCAVIVGSSETTFYVLAVYFGAIGIKKIRFALIAGLLADIFGIFAAIIVTRYFFC